MEVDGAPALNVLMRVEDIMGSPSPNPEVLVIVVNIKSLRTLDLDHARIAAEQQIVCRYRALPATSVLPVIYFFSAFGLMCKVFTATYGAVGWSLDPLLQWVMSGNVHLPTASPESDWNINIATPQGFTMLAEKMWQVFRSSGDYVHSNQGYALQNVQCSNDNPLASSSEEEQDDAKLGKRRRGKAKAKKSSKRARLSPKNARHSPKHVSRAHC